MSIVSLKLYNEGQLRGETEPLGEAMIDFYCDMLDAEIEKHNNILDSLNDLPESNIEQINFTWYKDYLGYSYNVPKDIIIFDDLKITIQFLGLCKRIIIYGEVLKTPLGMLSPFYESHINIELKDRLKIILMTSNPSTTFSISKQIVINTPRKQFLSYSVACSNSSKHLDIKSKMHLLNEFFLAKVI